MADTFIDRDIYIGEPAKVPVCADCGTPGEHEWIEITTFNDPSGQRRWVPAGRYRCPNGPHKTFKADHA